MNTKRSRAGSICLLAIALWFLPFGALAATQATHLCGYGKIWVPCVHLARPEDDFLRVNFRPTKRIPLVPNDSVFVPHGDPSMWMPDPDNYEPERARKFDKSIPSIETLTISPPTFDEAFVDPELAGMSTWLPPENHNVAVTSVEKVFHGDEIFEYWERATSAGVVCANLPSHEIANWDEIVHYCVFARGGFQGDRKTIEYCRVDEFEKFGGIKSNPICIGVADEAHGVRRVLSARYVEFEYRASGAAAEFVCKVPTGSRDKVVEIVHSLVKELVGTSSKYFETDDEGTVEYKAEGIDVEDRTEKMFLRTYIFGMVMPAEKSKSGTIVRFSMNSNMSVSAQSSENVIDYRDPSAAMGDRLRNAFEEKLRSAISKAWKGAHCRAQFGF